MTPPSTTDRHDVRSPPTARRYLAGRDADETAFERLLFDLRYSSICAWCLSPLRSSPAAPNSADGAGRAWVSDGVRRYCDHEACFQRGCLDGPPTDACRSKDELLDHYKNALGTLATFYRLEDNGFTADVDAGEAVVWEAVDNRRSGEGIAVIAEALAATFSPP